MTRDFDGSPLMIEHGSGTPPRHPDGSPVVTARLLPKLTQLELDLWSGDSLRAYLAKRIVWITRGEPVNGVDPSEFVQAALLRASGVPWYTRAAVSTWMYQEVSRARRRAERAPDLVEYYDDLEQTETPTELPDEVIEWLRERLPETSVTALVLYSEQALTAAEVCSRVGISKTTFYTALEKLRSDIP